MSIFITNLAFVGQSELVTSSKMAIFLASLTAGVAGYLWLQALGKPKEVGVGMRAAPDLLSEVALQLGARAALPRPATCGRSP